MKKCLLIGVIALSVALVVCSCAKSDEGQVAGTIQVPGGPKINVVFNGPPELEVSWEKLGMEGFQVHLIGTLRNVSMQRVAFSEIGFLFDGHQVAYIQGRTLEPGEEMKILKGFPGYSENTKVLEVRIKGFEKIEGSEISEPTTPEELSRSPFTKEVFTEAPKSLKTPGDLVAAFYFLCDEKTYSEAESLLTQTTLEDYRSRGVGLKHLYEEAFRGRQLKEVHIREVDEQADLDGNIDYYHIYYTLYFTDGSIIAEDYPLTLEKEDGKWKIGG